ncbi:MAG: DciA family protein [Bacteroidia bacterium]
MRKPILVGELLQGFWRSWEVRYAQAYVAAHWAQWMGDPIAQRTEGILAEGRTLKVFLNDPLLRQELHYRQSEILAFLHKQMGKEVFDKIVFYT